MTQDFDRLTKGQRATVLRGIARFLAASRSLGSALAPPGVATGLANANPARTHHNKASRDGSAPVNA